MDILTRAKGYVSARVVRGVAAFLSKASDTHVKKVFLLLSRMSPTKFHRETFRGIADMADQNHPFYVLWRSIFKDLHPNCRNKLVINLLVNSMIIGRGIRDKKEKEYNVHLPYFMVISPTMKCNLRCKGCYAAKYPRSEELSFEDVDRIITEAKELGMYFFTMSGGEIFTRKDMFDIWEKHNDAYFQLYTNGTLITRDVAKRLVELGNVAPMISIEGSKEETDWRRGKGVYDRVMEAMDILREEGVLFGFSATATRTSTEAISSEGFIDFMISKGAKVGWYFQYIPTGDAPDLEYMATPEQRALLRERVREYRRTKPIFLGDFWNDGLYVDGCMAAGERYMHIVATGDVEPCVFAHFAADNIHEKSLVEILKSPFFTKIREAAPYDDDNLTRPCMIIDHPWVLRRIVKETGAHPTHPGAEMLLGPLAPKLDEYARRVKEIFDPVWENEDLPLYMKLLSKEDKPYNYERFMRRRREVEERRKKEKAEEVLTK